MCTHNQRINITIDTNGPEKGPNAYGHDIFFFRYGNDNSCKLENLNDSIRSCTEEEKNNGSCPNGSWVTASGICNRTSNSGMNGFCASYALRNKYPDDASKTYWECLP